MRKGRVGRHRWINPKICSVEKTVFRHRLLDDDVGSIQNLQCRENIYATCHLDQLGLDRSKICSVEKTLRSLLLKFAPLDRFKICSVEKTNGTRISKH